MGQLSSQPVLLVGAAIALLSGGTALPSWAQSIVPAGDGTGSAVTPLGDRYDITGGQLSPDGTNQFHSFEQFGLSPAEVANFVTESPNLRNILGRVTGGDASVIRGLIQVTGVASPDLYLVNPAGLIFTESARIDVPGAFIATTASGIQFGESWWSAIGEGDYTTLVGNPTGFFLSGGTILNEGQLTVPSGESLVLLGGTVINTGTLTAPGGNITIAAVPDAAAVRLSQAGQLLTLEFATLADTSPASLPNALPFTPLALPELLAGGGAIPLATTVQSNPDGSISLASMPTAVVPQTGMAIASGTLDVANPDATGGAIQISGDRVGVFQADLDASGLTGGGIVQIGGTPHGGASSLQSQLTLIDPDSHILADAIAQGNGGQVVIWSDWVTHFAGDIAARGGIAGGDGGFVEVSGRDQLAFDGFVDVSAPLGDWGSLLLDPRNITIVSAATSDPPSLDIPSPGNPFEVNAGDDPNQDYQISAATLQQQLGNIFLAATNDIVIEDGLSLTFDESFGFEIVFQADADRDGGGDFRMDRTQTITAERRNISIAAQNITVGSLQTSGVLGGGNISLTAVGDILTGGDLLASVDSDAGLPSPEAIAGDIILSSDIGAIDVSAGALTSSGPIGGNIFIQAEGDIRTGFLQSFSFSPLSQTADGSPIAAGNIVVISNSGRIDTTAGNLTGEAVIANSAEFDDIVNTFNAELANIDAYADTGQGGDVYLSAPLGIRTSHISSFGPSGSGTIALDSIDGDINTGVIFSVSNDGIGTAGDTDDISANFPRPPSSSGGIEGNPSDILLLAGGDITTSHLLSATRGGGRSGDIFVTTEGRFNVQGALLYTRSQDGEAGTIDIFAVQSVEQLSDIVSDGNTAGGDVFIQSASGGLDLVNGEILSFAATGAAGNVRLEALDNIVIGSIDSSGLTVGGAIDIVSGTGSITTRDEITSASIVRDSDGTAIAGGTAGRITMSATGNILTGEALRSEGLVEGGAIALTAGGSIVTRGEISSLSPLGTAGNVDIAAGGDIEVQQDISSAGDLQGGNIGLRSATGSITTVGFLDSFSSSQNAGDVTITAPGQITVEREISSEGNLRGGAIRVTSSTSGIDINGNLDSFSLNGVASDVILEANNNIDVIGIDSSGPVRGGNISLTSAQGAIAIRDDITSESLRETDQNLVLGGGTAGNITVSALGDITTFGPIISEGLIEGGRIGMTSTAGSIINNGTLRSLSLFTDAAGNAIGGAAGSVVLASGISTVTQDVFSQGLTQGGNVQISTGLQPGSGGNLLVQGIASFAPSGTAGNIALLSNGGISTQGDLISEGRDRGGDITIRTARDMDTRLINVQSFSTAGTAGSVTYDAVSSIGFGLIDSNGFLRGGNISMTSRQNGIFGFTPLSDPNALSLNSFSAQGIAGDITLRAATGILMASGISSAGERQGGDVTLETREGNISIGDLLTSESNLGAAGSIALQAPQGAIISTGDLDSFSNAGSGGNVTARSLGNMVLQNLSTFGAQQSGDVTLESISGSITTLDIATTAPNGTSGSVGLTAQGNITTGNITSTGQLSGNINLSSIEGEVTTGELFSSTGDISVQGESVFGEGGLGDSGAGAISSTANETVADLEAERAQEFSDYFGQDLTGFAQSPEEINEALTTIEQLTGNRTAIIYIKAPVTVIERLDQRPSPLELVIFVPGQSPIAVTVPGVTQEQLFAEVQTFRQNLFTSLRRRARSYLPSAQRLYSWLIAPLESELGVGAVDTLLFSMDSGLRSLPIAALHDGNQYLIEKYSLGMVPSIGLMDTRYTSLANAQVLAMGASQFVSLNPLPAVPVELDVIAGLWNGETELNENFTRANLLRIRQTQPFQILHLATHAEFNPGTAGDSYIQLWGSDRLRLDELSSLNLDNPQVDLLVLSACQTALGNPEAELGFAGIAVASGVRSTLASLWSVSDEGTLALMTEFYDQLQESTIKSEALRNAQLSMLRGETRIESGQILRGVGATTRGAVVLPPQLGDIQTRNFSHPFYWAGFTMIGSPW